MGYDSNLANNYTRTLCYREGILPEIRYNVPIYVPHSHCDSNKSPTRCNNFPVYFLTFIYRSTCFGRFPAHHQELNYCSGSLWFYLRIVVTVVLCSWSGQTTNTARLPSRYEGKTRGGHCSHWAPDDGRENARNMLSCKQTSESKLGNCCIWLVIYLNCTMMHGLTNLKFTLRYSHQNSSKTESSHGKFLVNKLIQTDLTQFTNPTHDFNVRVSNSVLLLSFYIRSKWPTR